jgi:hypothetical protein
MACGAGNTQVTYVTLLEEGAIGTLPEEVFLTDKAILRTLLTLPYIRASAFIQKPTPGSYVATTRTTTSQVQGSR